MATALVARCEAMLRECKRRLTGGVDEEMRLKAQLLQGKLALLKLKSVSETAPPGGVLAAPAMQAPATTTIGEPMHLPPITAPAEVPATTVIAEGAPQTITASPPQGGIFAAPVFTETVPFEPTPGFNPPSEAPHADGLPMAIMLPVAHPVPMPFYPAPPEVPGLMMPAPFPIMSGYYHLPPHPPPNYPAPAVAAATSPLPPTHNPNIPHVLACESNPQSEQPHAEPLPAIPCEATHDFHPHPLPHPVPCEPTPGFCPFVMVPVLIMFR